MPQPFYSGQRLNARWDFSNGPLCPVLAGDRVVDVCRVARQQNAALAKVWAGSAMNVKDT